MNRALIIRPGVPELEEIELPDAQDERRIHELIGDWFSLAFHFPIGRGHRQIVAYCDDEGAYKTDLGWSCILDTTILREPWPIRGPLVITASVPPETVSMTATDLLELRLTAARDWHFPGGAGFMGPVSPEHLTNVPVLTRNAR